jgi:hypothetical protein
VLAGRVSVTHLLSRVTNLLAEELLLVYYLFIRELILLGHLNHSPSLNAPILMHHFSFPLLSLLCQYEPRYHSRPRGVLSRAGHMKKLEPFPHIPLKKMAFSYRPLKSSNLPMCHDTLFFFAPQAILSIFTANSG